MVCHIVLEDIHNEAFLDCLFHGIHVERMERAICVFCAEHFKGLPLGGCGKGKEGEVLVLAMNDHFLQQFVVGVNLVFC